LEVVAGEGGAVAAAAVEYEFGLFVGDELFDVAFDDAAPEVCGAGGVAGVPFVIFAHVYEARFGVRCEAAARRFHVEFADAGFGVFDESKEACGVLHALFGFSRRWMKKTGGIIIPVCESNPSNQVSISGHGRAPAADAEAARACRPRRGED
jgi:hypothetical protein